MERFKKIFLQPYLLGKDDNTVSSQMVAISVIAITFALLAVSAISSSKDLSFTLADSIVHGTIVVMFAFGILSLIIVLIHFCCQEKKVDFKTRPSPEQIKFVFLWIFGAGYLFQTVLYIMNFTSGEKNVTPQYHTPQYLLNLYFCKNVFVIIFIILQTILLTFSSCLSWRSSKRLQYAIAFSVCANATLWLQSVLREFKNHIGHQNANATNKHYNTSLGRFTMAVSVYTEPMLIEYALLSFTIIFSAWHPQSSRRPTEINVNLMTESTERSPLLRTSRSRNRCHLLGITYFVIMVAITLCTPFLTKDLQFLREFSITYQVLDILNITILITINLNVFHYFATQRDILQRSDIQHSGRTVLVLSCLGMQMCDVCGVFGAATALYFDSQVYHPIYSLHIVGRFFYFISSFYQTTFIIFLATSKHQAIYLPEDDSRRIKAKVLFMSAINFAFWFANFLFIHDNKRLSETDGILYGYKYWTLLRDILLPVVIYFRFHSSMELYEISYRIKSLDY